MTASITHIGSQVNRTARRLSTFGSGWIAIGLACAALILFLFVIGPMGLETRAVKPMADFIEENNINANAYYYTEVDEFFEAERHMREYLALIPGAQRTPPH